MGTCPGSCQSSICKVKSVPHLVSCKMSSVQLRNGRKMPAVGLGTWKSQPGQVANAVKYALQNGYTHIDCAAAYSNEKEIGQALKECLGTTIKREDLFVTSKLWNTKHAAADVRPSCVETLRDLGLDYLDLYLVHWPYGFKNTGEFLPKNPDGSVIYSDVHYMETWTEMEKLVDEGLCKAIGLSNFNSKQVEEVCSKGRIKPAVNQVECHPYLQADKLIEACRKQDVVITAYSPLGSGDRPAHWVSTDDPILLQDPVLAQIAAKYNKSPAQVAIRFQVQRGNVVIPKSVTPARILQNFQVFDFELSDGDMETMKTLDRNWRCCIPTVKDADGKLIARDGVHELYPFHEPY